MNKKLFGALSALSLSLLLVPATGKASVLYNGWYYAIDSLNDGSGGSQFEIRGLAYKIANDNIYFALSSGFPLGGVSDSGARNGKNSLGDLFLNFNAAGHLLTSAAAFNNANVYGIRFDASNDSLNDPSGNTTDPNTGVYTNISVASLSGVNNGFSTLANYAAAKGRTVNGMGDLQNTQSSSGDVATYLGFNQAMMTNMTAGTKTGSITSLNKTNLTGLGLDFGHFAGADPSGNHVFGFSFAQSLLPSGDFTAHLFEECINDGVAIKGSSVTLAAVPEPGTWALIGAGLLTIGSVFARRRMK